MDTLTVQIHIQPRRGLTLDYQSLGIVGGRIQMSEVPVSALSLICSGTWGKSLYLPETYLQNEGIRGGCLVQWLRCCLGTFIPYPSALVSGFKSSTTPSSGFLLMCTVGGSK